MLLLAMSVIPGWFVAVVVVVLSLATAVSSITAITIEIVVYVVLIMLGTELILVLSEIHCTSLYICIHMCAALLNTAMR